MKKAILAQKVLASVLAIGLGGFVLPLAAQANSGLKDEPQGVQGLNNKYYIGTNGAENNVVIIDSDLPEQDTGVIGGYAEKSGAVNNSVTFSGGEVNGSVYGGYSLSGEAKNNMVSINGVTIGNAVYGGFDFNRIAEANSVIINNSTVKDRVMGGNGDNSAKANSVVINGSTIGVNVYGGNSNSAEANSVVINGSTVGNNVYGGFSQLGNAKENSVVINGGKVENNVYGGKVSKSAEKNSVIINGDTVVNNVYGAEGNSVEKNNVTINGGTVVNDVYGGRGISSSKNNSVTVSGGMVKGEVYGGYVEDGGRNSTVIGNSVTLLDGAELNEADLYGGIILDWLKNDIGNETTVKDNKLVINGWSGTVGSLHNFNGAEGGIEVKALAGGLDLAADKNTAFVFAENGINKCNNDKLIKAENIQAGVALTVSGTIAISDDNQNIYINPTSVRASDQTAITTESRAAAAAFVNQGAEAVSDSINSLQGAEAGISTFATVSGNNSKYDTGSYVDINGWNGIVGVAKTKDLNAGKFSYGAFFENGGGNYNTYNDFNGTSFRGDGNVVYNGGGLLMRYERENGVYTEASLRAGTAKNEVSNALEFTGNRYGFKTENAYYGAHIGIGKIIKLDNGKAWDIYGKYFHTHHEGDSVKIANDVFDFDSVDSDKLRIGARFSEKQGEKLTSYYGLAWEYEFSGDAGGTANHYAMYTPSLEGSTVIGEVGFRYTPGKASPWYFDANVRGYAGMQEGISGSVQAVYSF